MSGTIFDSIAATVSAHAGALRLQSRYHVHPKHIDSDYELTDRVVGRGCGGEVLLARLRDSSRSTKQACAVKSLALARVPPAEMQALKVDVCARLCVDYPHIAQLNDVYESESHLHLVMERLEGEELFHRMSGTGSLDERSAADIVRQMLLVFGYLQGHGISHGDVKLESFLFDQKGSAHLKLIDFGIHGADGRASVRRIEPALPRGDADQCEMFNVGVIAYMLLSGTAPFRNASRAEMWNVSTGAYHTTSESWRRSSPQAKQLVRMLMHTDPKARLIAQDALANPWLAGSGTVGSPGVALSVVESLRAFPQLPKLQRCCLFMMAQVLTNEEQAVMREQFLSLNKSHQGAISMTELQGAMSRLTGCSDPEVLSVLSAMSVLRGSSESQVGDAALEMRYSEFLAAVLPAHVRFGDDLLRAAFHKFDANDAGSISSHDLRNVLGDTLEGHSVDALAREAGLTLGTGGAIQYPEFAAFIRRSCTAAPTCAQAGSEIPTPFNGQRFGIEAVHKAFECAAPFPKCHPLPSAMPLGRLQPSAPLKEQLLGGPFRSAQGMLSDLISPFGKTSQQRTAEVPCLGTQAGDEYIWWV